MKPHEQALIQAIGRGDLKELKKQLKRMSNVNAPIENGKRVLHYAAEKTFGISAIEIFDYLLALPTTQIDVEDDRGLTPLLLAAMSHNFIGVKKLIEHGANYNTTRRDGRPLLSLLASDRNAYEEIANLIRKQEEEKKAISDLSAAPLQSIPSTLTLRKHAGTTSQEESAQIEWDKKTSKTAIPSTESRSKHWLSSIINFFQERGKQKNEEEEQAGLLELKQR